MGRMHSKGKGISASAKPYKRTPPTWLKISSQDVEDNICKFAKKGLTPSQIGVILRDFRPEKYLGDLETWDKAEKALEGALNEFGKLWQITDCLENISQSDNFKFLNALKVIVVITPKSGNNTFGKHQVIVELICDNTRNRS